MAVPLGIFYVPRPRESRISRAWARGRTWPTTWPTSRTRTARRARPTARSAASRCKTTLTWPTKHIKIPFFRLAFHSAQVFRSFYDPQQLTPVRNASVINISKPTTTEVVLYTHLPRSWYRRQSSLRHFSSYFLRSCLSILSFRRARSSAMLAASSSRSLITSHGVTGLSGPLLS